VAPRETNPDLARTQPDQQENHDEAVPRTPTEQQENYGNTDNTQLHKYRKKTIDKPTWATALPAPDASAVQTLFAARQGEFGFRSQVIRK